jgi:hypothetical protein
LGDHPEAAADGEDDNVGPLAWLTQTLERVASGWPSSEIDALMPWKYAG